MKIKDSHLCKCGHPAIAHTIGAYNSNTEATLKTVLKCSINCDFCSCKKFQLPNLDLIEYLAEQRGLI